MTGRAIWLATLGCLQLAAAAPALAAPPFPGPDAHESRTFASGTYNNPLGGTETDSKSQTLFSAGNQAASSLGLGGGMGPGNVYLGALGGLAQGTSGNGFGKAFSQVVADFATGAIEAQTSTRWTVETVANHTAKVVFNTLFDRVVAITDPVDFTVRADQVLAGAISSSFDVGSNAPEAFVLGTQTRFTFRVEDLDSGIDWQVDVFDIVSRQINIGFDAGLGTYFTWGGLGDFAQTQKFVGRSGSFIDRARTDVVIGAEGGVGFAATETVTLATDMIQGNRYRLTMDVACTSSVLINGTILPSLGERVGAGCDASRSGYYGGVASALGGNNQPVQGFSLTSGSGTNLVVPSPSFPVSAVPEPANWALLIAGFGLTGAVARRRRALLA